MKEPLARKPHDFEKLRSPTNAASDWRGAGSVDYLALETSIKPGILCLRASQIWFHLILWSQIACVASVSNRVSARKLEREQNRKRLSSFIPLPLPRHSFFFLLSSQLSRRTREEALATQASYLRYIQAFWGWILSWQLSELCCIFCILTQTKSRVGSRSC